MEYNASTTREPQAESSRSRSQPSWERRTKGATPSQSEMGLVIHGSERPVYPDSSYVHKSQNSGKKEEKDQESLDEEKKGRKKLTPHQKERKNRHKKEQKARRALRKEKEGRDGKMEIRHIKKEPVDVKEEPRGEEKKDSCGKMEIRHIKKEPVDVKEESRGEEKKDRGGKMEIRHIKKEPVDVKEEPRGEEPVDHRYKEESSYEERRFQNKRPREGIKEEPADIDEENQIKAFDQIIARNIELLEQNITACMQLKRRHEAPRGFNADENRSFAFTTWILSSRNIKINEELLENNRKQKKIAEEIMKNRMS